MISFLSPDQYLLGFSDTKLCRSKNLDILFKREYYEQRIATQKQLSEAAAAAKEASEKKDDDSNDEPEADNAANTSEIISEKDMVASTPTLDKIDPDEIREFKPMNHGLETPLPDLESGQTSPYHYPGQQQYPTTTTAEQELPMSEAAYVNGQARPNLYLYSPSSNTLIPCDEIIIPNPVMSPETGNSFIHSFLNPVLIHHS